MYKNTMMIISIVLTFSLLTSCEGSDNKALEENHTSSHASGHHEPSSTNHSGHNTTIEVENHLQASFSFDTDYTKANTNSDLTIQITDHNGQALNEFDLNHEKLLHLIVVNQDLSYFKHLHPQFVGAGKFTINTNFPTGGEYKLFADFIPSGGSSTTLSDWIHINGDMQPAIAISADKKLVTVVSGKKVELELCSVHSNEEVTLSFNILDAVTNNGIDNLEQYLGAVGHVVILSDDAEQYLHVHPIDEHATGPIAKFTTSFPTSGTYKLWGQFQHKGEVFTVPFVIDVK